MAAEFIPTVMSRGFHARPVFGIFGAAVAAADEDQIHSAIAQCVKLANGRQVRAAAVGHCARVVRSATLCSPLPWRSTHPKRRNDLETTLEGEAGFYHAYAGSNRGELRFASPARTTPTLAKSRLCHDWIFLETLYRIYSTAGYDIAHIDVTARLCEEHDIAAADIDQSKPWSTGLRPSILARPSRAAASRAHRRQHPIFHGLGRGRAPLPAAARSTARPRRDRSTVPPAPLELMHRVTPVPTVRRLCSARGSLCSPRMAGAHQGRHRPRVHLGFRRGGQAHPPYRTRPRDQ
jgi:hypothetical protein